MKDFNQLVKNLKKDFSNFRKVRVALLGDTSTQFLAQAIRGMGYEKQLDLLMWEADYDQIEQQVYDSGSELYEFQPDIVIIFLSSQKLLKKYNRLKPEEYHLLALQKKDFIENLYKTIIQNHKTKVIFYNFTELDDGVFGSYANKTASSFLFQLRKLNHDLMCFAERNKDFYLCDISIVHNLFGRSYFFHPSMYIHSDMVLSIDVLPYVAARTVDIISAIYGKIIKCVVLDLDNTLWGGTIGDDGLENIQIGNLGIGKAYTEFQYWLKKLKNRGVLLAVCSKNNENIAKEPFVSHPDMVLRLEDIAVFVANWENKVVNIQHIQRQLNIGFDAMVFIDDNAFERNMVRENVPDIIVPEMPDDPAEYLEYLNKLNLFETISFTEEDALRTKQYLEEAQRNSHQQKFFNEEDFLKSLNMVSLAEPFNKFNTPRVAQLSQRSNQFNLRTIRYTEADVEAIARSENHFAFAFTLEDRFGDSGLVCVVVLKKEDSETLFIENWFMSCRVLKRGLEQFVLNKIVSCTKENGFRFLKGEYVPTAKNAMVKNHYEGLGFEASAGFWILNVENYKEKLTHIKPKTNYGKK